MNDFIRITISNIKKIIKWANANPALLEKYPMVKEQIEELKNLLQNLEEMVVITDMPIKNYAKVKEKIKQLYLKSLLPLMANLLALGRRNVDNYLIQLTNYSKTDLGRMRDELLIAKGKEVKEYCDNHTTEVEAIGITSEETQTMTSLRVDYEDKTNAPAVAYAARKKNNAKMYDMASTASNKIHKEFIPLSRGVLEYNEPESWAELYTLVYKNPEPVRHYDVIGKIIDAATQKAVPYATLEVVELEQERKLKSKGGVFYLSDVPPGTYTAICTQPNYHPKTVVFRKIAKTVTRVTIEMDFNPIDQDTTPKTTQQKRKTTTKKQPTNRTEPQTTTTTNTPQPQTKTAQQQPQTEVATTAEPAPKKQPKAKKEKNTKNKAAQPKDSKPEAADA